MTLAVTLALVSMLVLTGLVLTWAYEPDAGGAVSGLRAVHRGASALLLPASWALVFTMVWSRWGQVRRARWVRWATPAAVVLAVLAAAFTGFLLPWETVHVPSLVIAPDRRGMGVAFDAATGSVAFGREPISRATFQRFVVAHLALGLGVVGLTLFVARTAARGRRPDSGNS